MERLWNALCMAWVGLHRAWQLHVAVLWTGLGQCLGQALGMAFWQALGGGGGKPGAGLWAAGAGHCNAIGMAVQGFGQGSGDALGSALDRPWA